MTKLYSDYTMKNISRRKFIENAVTLAASSALLPNLAELSPFGKTEKPIGIQLYSFRDDIKDGYIEDVLKGVAKAGYSYVEGFGLNKGKIFDKTPSEFRKMLKEHELKISSGHYTVSAKHYDSAKKDFTDDFKKAVEDALKMGQRYFVTPWTEEADRKTADAFKEHCDLLNKAGEYCKNQNIRFGYHNHEFEFTTKWDGKMLYDVLMENTQQDLVTMEMDMCWVVFGKQNVVELFKKYPQRFELAHFKDLAEEGVRETAIVGEGVIDFPEILKNMKKGGVRMLIVELENYKKSPMDDTKVCYKNLRKMLDKLD